MIEYLFKTLRNNSYIKLDASKPGCWINVCEPNNEELEVIAKLVKLDVEDLVDALDEYEIPRIENYDGTVLLFIRKPNDKKDTNVTDTLTIVYTEEHLVTITANKTDSFIEGIKSATSLAPTTQKSKLLLQILLRASNEFTRRVKNIKNKVTGHKKLSHISNTTIMSLVADQDILDQYVTALIPMRNVLETLYGGNYIKFHEEDRDLLEDMIMAIRQIGDICNTNMKSMKNLVDAYQIIFTNNLNNEIRVLTYITVTLAIPTFIAGFYGMNIALPLQLHPHAFMIISSLTAALVIVTLFMVFRFSRKR